MICRSHAVCEYDEGYIIIRAWVIACIGYLARGSRALSSGSYQNGKGSKYLAKRSWSVGDEGCGPSYRPCPASRNFCSGSEYICMITATGGVPNSACFCATAEEAVVADRQ